MFDWPARMNTFSRWAKQFGERKQSRAAARIHFDFIFFVDFIVIIQADTGSRAAQITVLLK
jgi:hypothetical protein